MFGLEALFFGALLGAGASMLMKQQAPDLSGPIAQSTAAHQAALDAIAESEKRVKEAQERMIPGADNENALRAAENRQRKLARIPGTLFAGSMELAQPSIGYKMLMGA